MLIQKIPHVKRQSQAKEIKVREKVRQAEVQYVEEPTLDRYGKWVERQEEYRKLMLEKAENKRMFQRQNFFGEGERVGRTLVLIAKANSDPQSSYQQYGIK